MGQLWYASTNCILASQVHQAFYAKDPIENRNYYARNKDPGDLYDLGEENCSNISDILEGV